MFVLDAATAAIHSPAIPYEQSFQRIVETQILHALHEVEKVPGLQKEFTEIREAVLQVATELFKNGEILSTGKDAEYRDTHVGLQAVVEFALTQLLKKGEISEVDVVIHTPMPPTPLCTHDKISDGLVHPEIEEDPKRLCTVLSRITILRELLAQGANIYCAYPKEGMAGRNAEQQEIYRNTIAKNAAYLFDRPLDCESIESGAFYIIKNKDGQKLAFAIKINQANSPLLDGQYGLWFGDVELPAIRERINGLLDIINKSTRESLPAI